MKTLASLLLTFIALYSASCAGTPPPRLEDARQAIVTTGEGLERARAGMLAVCDESPPLPPLSPAVRVRCDDAIAGLNAAIGGYQVVRQVVP